MQGPGGWKLIKRICMGLSSNIEKEMLSWPLRLGLGLGLGPGPAWAYAFPPQSSGPGPCKSFNFQPPSPGGRASSQLSPEKENPFSGLCKMM